MSILPQRGRPFVDAPCTLSDDELVERGKAIFRNIIGRKAAGLCTRRIARDRYCPRPAAEGSMTCDQHPLIVPDGWDDPEED